MPAEWSPELTLDNGRLDEQHQELFRLVGVARRAVEAGLREDAAAAMGLLGDALLAHVAEEDALMEESAYPERQRHRMAHELFVADFTQLKAELDATGPTPRLADALRSRVGEWLRFHVLSNDAPLALHLARRRAQPRPGPAPSQRRPS